MIKKITAIILTLLLVCQVSVFAADEYDYKKVLQTLGAIDQNSEFAMDSLLTRAQFAKMAVMISSKRDFVATNLSVAPFVDVTHKHWSAPYVHIAVSNGIINGYVDGTFKPENPIKYEEAITIALKLLGYTNDDFGASWPNGQLGMADKIGLTDNFTVSTGKYIDRKDTIKLLYNTLNTPQKNNSSNYINILGYAITEDVTVIATSNEDSSVKTDSVYTSAGTFKKSDDFDHNSVGKDGSIITKDGKLILFLPDDMNKSHETYTVYAPLANDVLVYKNGTITNLGVPSYTTVYSGGQQSTLKNVLQTLDIGYTLNISRKTDGSIDYVTVMSNSLEGPFIATSSFISGYKNAKTVIRDGVKSSISSLESNDVLYYSDALSTIWAYTKKVTGIYESATPNKDTPQSITVSGKTYALEGANAYSALSSQGNLNFGDTITLLIGRNGDVAGVVGAQSQTEQEEFAGYLIGSGQKSFTNSNGDAYNSLYVTVVQTDGNVYEYTTKANYSQMINQIVTVSFEDGKATLKKQQKQSEVSGIINYETKKIGNYKLADDIEILDISSTDPSDAALYKNIFLQRLDGAKLGVSSILYTGKNDAGEIDKMILKNFTGDIYTYGIVTKAEKSTNGNSASYTYISGGNTSSLTSSAIFSVTSGQPAKFIVNGNRLSSVIPLTYTGSLATSLSAASLKSGSKPYSISDKVVVYERTIATTYAYLDMPISELIESQEDYNIKAYVDDNENMGGRVRVIIAEKKK